MLFNHLYWSIFPGKIACANVISDLYAMGVTECDNMLMLLGVSTKMTEKERDVVVPLIMRGFKDSALEAGTTVTGGQTVVNPWCTVGGVASTVCQPNEYIVYVLMKEWMTCDCIIPSLMMIVYITDQTMPLWVMFLFWQSHWELKSLLMLING